MVIYDRLWETLRQKGITQYRLIKYYKVSSGQIGRLKKNAYISTHTIDVLCTILQCRIEDIMEFVPDTEYNPALGLIPGKTLLTNPPEKKEEGSEEEAPAISELGMSEEDFKKKSK